MRKILQRTNQKLWKRTDQKIPQRMVPASSSYSSNLWGYSGRQGVVRNKYFPLDRYISHTVPFLKGQRWSGFQFLFLLHGRWISWQQFVQDKWRRREIISQFDFNQNFWQIGNFGIKIKNFTLFCSHKFLEDKWRRKEIFKKLNFNTRFNKLVILESRLKWLYCKQGDHGAVCWWN